MLASSRRIFLHLFKQKKNKEFLSTVCGTTGKRKACKDCSCGLAEELEAGKAVKAKAVTSSCGSVSFPQINVPINQGCQVGDAIAHFPTSGEFSSILAKIFVYKNSIRA